MLCSLVNRSNVFIGAIMERFITPYVSRATLSVTLFGTDLPLPAL